MSQFVIKVEQDGVVKWGTTANFTDTVSGGQNDKVLAATAVELLLNKINQEIAAGDLQ